jgi:hypothetical protein
MLFAAQHSAIPRILLQAMLAKAEQERQNSLVAGAAAPAVVASLDVMLVPCACLFPAAPELPRAPHCRSVRRCTGACGLDVTGSYISHLGSFICTRVSR